MQKKIMYHAAIYLRLSRDDEDIDGSAFLVTFSNVQFPPIVVIPNTSKCCTANIIANASSCPGSQSKITFLIFSPPLLPGVLLKIFLVLFDQGCFVPLFCLPYIQKRHFLKSSSLLAIAHSAVH